MNSGWVRTLYLHRQRLLLLTIVIITLLSLLDFNDSHSITKPEDSSEPTMRRLSS